MPSMRAPCMKWLYAAAIAGGVFGWPALVDAAQEKSPYRPTSLPKNAKKHHLATGGIDNLKVRRTASGNLIRFSYRVTDAERAKGLNDKQAKPYLISHRS